MRRDDKPWGYEIIWAEQRGYVGKILHIRAGFRLSRQFHRVKEESFLVQSGELDLELGPPPDVETRRLVEGDTFHCHPGTIHRVIARTDVVLLEVSTPELHDIVRIEDAYGRIPDR